MMTAQRIKRERRKKKENRLVDNQVIMEEETEITEVEDTSIAGMIDDLSQGCPN